MVKIRNKTTKKRRQDRVRAKIHGTARRPRLSVFRSNRYFYAQLIDDDAGKTLLTIDDKSKAAHGKVSKTEAAFELGKQLAERAKEAELSAVVFDKGSYKYHGRVKSFAEGARKGGLVF